MKALLDYWPIITTISAVLLGIALFVINTYFRFKSLGVTTEHNEKEIALLKAICTGLDKENTSNKELISDYYLKVTGDIDRAKLEHKNALLEHRQEVDKELTRLERIMTSSLDKIKSTTEKTDSAVERLASTVESYIEKDSQYKQSQQSEQLKFYKEYGGPLEMAKRNFEKDK